MTIERRFTPERNEIIKRDWPLGVDSHTIVKRLLELPGTRDVTVRHVGVQAAGLGVRRPFGPGMAQRGRPAHRSPNMMTSFKFVAPRKAYQPRPEDDAAVAEFIRTRGVTLLPAAASEITTAAIPAEDRHIVAAYHAAQAEARNAEYMARAQRIQKSKGRRA